LPLAAQAQITKSPRFKSEAPPLADHSEPDRNDDYDWSQFDSESYFQHYYGDPHPDDDCVVRLTVEAFKRAPPQGKLLSTLDIGAGPNLFPSFAALPRASQITAWEYAKPNIDWLARELVSSSLRPQWRHFWDVARAAYGADYDLPDNPIPALKSKMKLRQGSIFDLPAKTWDAATMFFCAESITRSRDEFETACAAFARSVHSGGALIAAFLVRSSGGYVVGERPFPVLSISAEEIVESFSRYATDVESELVGIVEREIRSGYAGFVFVTARAL
jgi:NNMT/PNMT/TEMT family